MRPVKFYIDEPVLHDSTIESKKDFKKLLTQMQVANVRSTNLSVAWIAGVSACLMLIVGLSFFYSVDQDKSQELVANIPISNSTPLETPSESLQPESLSPESLRFTISPTDSSESDNSSEMTVDNIKSDKNTEVLVLQVEKHHDNPNIIRNRIEPIKSLHTRAVATAHQGLASTSSSIRIPRGLPISVDLVTYAEIKMADDFYFELDSSAIDKTETMMAYEWKEAELRHHPVKNKYRMILSNGKEQLEFIVRLVIQSNSQIHHNTRKFRLRNLID